MNARQELKRKLFTQVIADNKACFRACTQAVNMCVTGMSSEELRKKYALGERDSIRSVLPKEQVDLAAQIEANTAIALENVDNYGQLNTLAIVTQVMFEHQNIIRK